MTQPLIKDTDLIKRVMREGVRDRAAAARAIEATLDALGGCLAPEDARLLSGALSRGLARRVGRARPGSVGDVEAFFEQVREREGAQVGTAREHACVVLRALAEELEPDLRARLARALPQALAAWFAPRGVPAPAGPPPLRRAPPLPTLATGRPGSLHPLSEAAPAAAHAQSVARAANPHGEAKLSSARGLTQEQLGASLATGREPAPARTISEAHDGGAGDEADDGDGGEGW